MMVGMNATAATDFVDSSKVIDVRCGKLVPVVDGSAAVNGGL